MIPATTYGHSEITASEPHEPIGSQLLNGVFQIGFNSASGYLAGFAFGIVNPVGGAIFGATSAASSLLISLLAEKMGVNNTCAKVAITGASFIIGIGIAAAAATAAGFPITFMAGLGLTLTMLLTSLAIRMVTGGMFCCSACVGGAALAMKERFV